MAKANLKVMLLRATPDPDEVVALGARLCYAQADLDALRERVETTDQQKYIAGVMARGHLSVTEHASFTFAVEGVSRALLAQLTRHRIASFSVDRRHDALLARPEAVVAEHLRERPSRRLHRRHPRILLRIPIQFIIAPCAKHRQA